MTEVCYACKDDIEEGDWVIPLETLMAAYLGDELVLDIDNKMETVIHADCLQLEIK